VFANIPLTKGQNVFTNLDSLLSYASSKNIALQTGEIRLSQAKNAKLMALLAVPDLILNPSLNYTNNTQLPVNIFPAEILGGQKGTFQEVKLGVQYNTNFNVYGEIKLLNLQSWENLKLSKLNITSTNFDNKISLKNLYEDIAAIYFNIVSLQEQLKSTQENILAADTLQKIVQNKYQQGLVKQQEVNNAKVNYLNTLEIAKQIEYLTEQQYLALKTLCDIPANEVLQIKESLVSQNNSSNVTQNLAQIPTIDFNDLLINATFMKEKKAFSNFRQIKLAQLPTISFVFSQSQQQYNSNATLFDNSVKWIPSSYIGIKLNWNLPSANAVSQVFRAKYDYEIAKKNTEQTKIHSELTHKQLGVNHDKALSQWNTHKAIYELNTETYQKNFNLYQDGLLSLDQTLDSFNAKVNSNYNMISSAISILLAKSKISINNKIK
jgi:outer membrane protein TolC